MEIPERHTSPDDSMVLIVESVDNDFTIGFEGFSWHTHGDILDAWGYQGSPETRTQSFINDVLESRRAIAIVKVDGIVCDICIPEDLFDRPLSTYFNKYAPPNETTEFRYWNGLRAVE